jgi:hypothetical protein
VSEGTTREGDGLVAFAGDDATLRSPFVLAETAIPAITTVATAIPATHTQVDLVGRGRAG